MDVPPDPRPGNPTSDLNTSTLAVGRPAWTTIPPQPLTLANLPTWAGSVATAVGLIALLGWIADVDALKSMFPSDSTMKANTAVCVALVGAGLVLMSRSGAGSGRRLIGLGLITAASAIAIATASQFVTGRDLGIDQLLLRETGDVVANVVPGRMSPLTAICLILVGSAALLAGIGRVQRLVVALAGVAIVVSAVQVFHFVFGGAVPSFLEGYSQMAVNAAIAIGILGLGVIGLLGPRSPLVPLAGRSASAVLLRRLLIVSVLVPVLMGSLRVQGQTLGLYDTSYGTSLMVVGMTALIVVAILYSGRWASALETKREAAELERDRFFDMSPDMLSVIDADGRFRRVNRAWESVLGYPTGELVGRSFFDLVNPDDLDRTVEETQRHFGLGEPNLGFLNRYRHHDGTYRWLEWTSQTAPDQSVAFAVARDVTDRKREEDSRASQRQVLETRNEALSERAVRDPLTGLHNRRYFDAEVERLEGRWSQLPVEELVPVSIVIFDLDHFGKLNKQHGHQAGDAVLRLFSGLLAKRFRDRDLVARYGGEEFVAVLEGATSADAIRIAEDIRTAFEGASVEIGTNNAIRATVSAGCAQLGEDRSISAGLSVADVWLSQAKRAGRNQVVGL
jgi:diguanylate cyclase (GGDEF)-like protein/PAS domain S-box-containing protein